MKLSQRAIDALTHRERRMALMLALDFTEIWIGKLLETNKDNGPLTTMAALKAIKDQTGLTDEEILEAEEASSELGR